MTRISTSLNWTHLYEVLKNKNNETYKKVIFGQFEVLNKLSEDGERAAAGVLAERLQGSVGPREVAGPEDDARAHQEGEHGTAVVVHYFYKLNCTGLVGYRDM